MLPPRLCYYDTMKLFPWFKKETTKAEIKKPHKILKRVLAGLVIGGAIGSIVGKRVIDRVRSDQDDDIEM